VGAQGEPHSGARVLLPVVNPETGEVRQAAIFVALLGASNYTFAEATESQDLACWIASHIPAFEFLGGTPKLKVEAGVLPVERWMVAALRHRRFFSLAELNQAIAEWNWKQNRALARRLANGRLKNAACVEDIDFRRRSEMMMTYP